MKPYDDLRNTINIEVRLEDERAVQHYVATMKLLKCIAILALFTYMALLVTDKSGDKLVAVAAILLIILYYGNKKRMGKRVRGIILNQCDAKHMISYCTALIQKSTKMEAFGEHLFNIGAALYYEGRFEDTDHMIELMGKYRQNNMDDFRRQLLICRVCFARKDYEAVKYQGSVLADMASHVKLSRIIKNLYEEASQFEILMQVEQAGAYEKMRVAYEHATSYYASNLSEVKKNYYLYEIAVKLGDMEQAEACKRVVLEKGGTLWYKKELY